MGTYGDFRRQNRRRYWALPLLTRSYLASVYALLPAVDLRSCEELRSSLLDLAEEGKEKELYPEQIFSEEGRTFSLRLASSVEAENWPQRLLRWIRELCRSQLFFAVFGGVLWMFQLFNREGGLWSLRVHFNPLAFLLFALFSRLVLNGLKRLLAFRLWPSASLFVRGLLVILFYFLVFSPLSQVLSLLTVEWPTLLLILLSILLYGLSNLLDWYFIWRYERQV